MRKGRREVCGRQHESGLGVVGERRRCYRFFLLEGLGREMIFHGDFIAQMFLTLGIHPSGLLG